jgi:hypothetical protein
VIAGGQPGYRFFSQSSPSAKTTVVWLPLPEGLTMIVSDGVTAIQVQDRRVRSHQTGASFIYSGEEPCVKWMGGDP